MPTPANQTILQAQLTALGERMDAGFKKLEDMLMSQEARVRGLENREAGCQPLLQSRLDAEWREIDALKEAKNTLDKKLQEQALTIRQQATELSIVKWAGGTVTVAVISWIIGQTLGLIK